MVGRDGRVKILDFGLAKGGATEAVYSVPDAVTIDSALSSEGQVIGTVPYMAPEQVRGLSVDARSDLFSLGIILFELVTGRRPFTGATPADVASSILRDTPEPLSTFRTDLPDGLDRVAARCLEKDPRDRYPAALDVLNDLRRVKAAHERGDRAGTTKPAARGVATIAVLPFVNRSASPEDEYFSDGLADELLNVLAKIRGLRVAARASSFTFKGKNATATEIGQALRVASILEGTVRKVGNRVRISVQLVQVSDGFHIWSETYDRMLEDIFAVQDDIARAVVKELRTALLGEEADSRTSGEVKAEVARAARGRGTSPEAHRLHLLPRHLVARRTREDTAKAIEYLEEAVRLDPEFALAWADLGTAHSAEASSAWGPVAEGYRRARRAVERALDLEPDLAEGHAELGRIRMLYEWDWRGAERSLQRALELAPANPLALRVAGALAQDQGRLEESIGFYRRVLEDDPLSAGSYHNMGLVLYMADRFADAEEAYRNVLELGPQRMLTRAYLSLSLLGMGKSDEAAAEAAREPHPLFRLWAIAIVAGALGRAAESDAALRELIEKFGEDGAYQIAEVYGARGEADPAFEWLHRAFAQRDPGLSELRVSPPFRSLHGDPRWSPFLERIGLDR